MRNLFVSCFLILFSCLSSYSQTDQDLGLHSGGGLWNFYPAIEKNDSLKNVLLIGDSVMNGFRQFVIDSLKKTANVDCWLTPFHLKSEHLFADLQKVVSSKHYDVIQFNNGLHGWPKGRILDDRSWILKTDDRCWIFDVGKEMFLILLSNIQDLLSLSIQDPNRGCR